ncbi:hypothetical protein AVEN_233950-1 [Araneus ventricosus]|uniref:Uncharacterized protein n=1 Tax=Araneus ventricosus TaxID=182803 RepID=A0A4Y2VFP8_ARAVE|nr:hypothetical protein AVEN_45207-1 [Araneus ventricosus]GBO23511.1 hypothetical protein AVEN_233950-1 [Araneus ventricosus]
MPCHRYEVFKQSYVSSAGDHGEYWNNNLPVPWGITGSVCRKPPVNTMVMPPILLLLRLMSFNVTPSASNSTLWDIVHSSQTISLKSFIKFAFP